MNVLNLSIFSLLILGALVQAKHAKQSKSTEADPTVAYVANAIASYAEEYYLNRKNNILNKFSKELVTLKTNSDHCTLKKAKKLEDLRQEFKDAPLCTLLPQLVTTLTVILQDIVNIVLQVFRVVGTLVTSLVMCITTFNPECVLAVLANLIQEVIGLFPQVGELVGLIATGVIAAINELLRCLHTQELYEDRFDSILKTMCNEMY